MHVHSDSAPRRWLQRLAWLGVLWIAGVAVMGLVAVLLRALMGAVGLAS